MNAQLYLNVPIEHKDRAKGLGARWDSALRKWYVPHRFDIEQFREWWPASLQKEADALNDKKKPRRKGTRHA